MQGDPFHLMYNVKKPPGLCIAHQTPNRSNTSDTKKPPITCAHQLP